MKWFVPAPQKYILLIKQQKVKSHNLNVSALSSVNAHTFERHVHCWKDSFELQESRNYVSSSNNINNNDYLNLYSRYISDSEVEETGEKPHWDS